MIRWLTLSLFLFFGKNSNAQKQDTAGALRQIESLLQSGSSVEKILTDKNWMFLHAKTEFRSLIKKFATTELTIISPEEKGNKITVAFFVKDESGKAIANLSVYCYHTDSRGFYGFDTTHVFGNEGDRRHARLFGYLKTNSDGRFILHTIHPVGYPKSILPSHIHCEMEAPGFLSLITELRFDEDPRLNEEQRRQSRLEGFMIAKSNQGTYQYEIILKRNKAN